MQLWIDSPGQWAGTSPSLNATLVKAYTSVSGGGFSIIASGRFSRRALGSWGTLNKTFDAPAPATLEGYIGIYTVAGTGFFFGPKNTAGPQLSCVLEADGTITVRRGTSTGTIIGQTAFALQMGSGYYIEFGFLIANSGGWVEIRVNNDSKLLVEGVDTCLQTEVTWNGCSWSFQNEIADLYVNDSSGDLNTGYRGDTRVDLHAVNEDGDTVEWTPLYSGANYENVNEAQVSEADYNSAADVDLTDLYGLVALINAGGLISGIALWPYVWKTDAGACAVRARLKIGATEYPHAQSKYPSTSGYYFPVQYDASPASGSPPDEAFSESEFNSMQVGLDRVA